MPLVMSNAELARIRRWTDPNREEPEMVKKRELLRLMHENSSKMTKNWPNSVENVNKRSEELRQARIALAEQANSRFYKKYVKNRREEQKRLMYSARDTVFKNKDAPKLLLSAVIETCVQKERITQLKFDAERKRVAAEKKRQEDDDIIRKAKEWHELNAGKKKLRYEVDLKHQQDLVDQAHEIAERNRREYESELNMQKIDNMKANQQMDALKEFEENFIAEERARIFKDMDQAKREANNRKLEQQARDKLDDKLLEVLLKSRARIENKRLETDKKVKSERQAVLEKISARLESGDAARAAKDNEILQKAIREKELIAENRDKADMQKKADIKAARQQQREQWLKDEAQRLHEVNTKLQWDCMNRFKNLELYEHYKEQEREKRERKIQEFREDMLRQWKERDDREARERAETRHFYGELAEQKLRDADNKLLTHAQDLLEEARANNRPEFALVRAVDRYCHMNRLYPLPSLPTSLKEHFQEYEPLDLSLPDADYKVPPRPDDDAVPASDRNGLQAPNKATTSTAPPSAKQPKAENVADYKRSGKANGMQRKDDVSFPPISVVLCKHAACPHRK